MGRFRRADRGRAAGPVSKIQVCGNNLRQSGACLGEPRTGLRRRRRQEGRSGGGGVKRRWWGGPHAGSYRGGQRHRGESQPGTTRGVRGLREAPGGATDLRTGRCGVRSSAAGCTAPRAPPEGRRRRAGYGRLGTLLFPNHRSGGSAKAGGRHRRALAGQFLIRRKLGTGAGSIPSDADGNSTVEPWTALQLLLGRVPFSIATAVRGRYNGAGYYRVVDFAVDAVPGSLLESVADQRPANFESSNWLSTNQQDHEVATSVVTEVRWNETLENLGDLRLNRHCLRALDAAFEPPIC